MSMEMASTACRDDEPLSRSVLGWYSVGAFPGGVGLLAGTFIVFYYNQVLGVPGSTVGLAIMAASVFDAITDPIAGAISDRTRSRFGRRHPYMLMCAIPLGIVFYLHLGPACWLGAGRACRLAGAHSLDTAISGDILHGALSRLRRRTHAGLS